MAGITLRLDDSEVRRVLRRLRDREVGRVAAEALNKTSFDMRDAEGAEVGSSFEFAGSATRKFLTGGFRFDKATASKLQTKLYPLRRTERVLGSHVEGETITGRDKERLRFGDKLAVPLKPNLRGARGRVRKGKLPGTLVTSGRGFVSRTGRSIMERQRSGRARVLFALVRSARLRARFDFYGTAEKTARRVFASKLTRSFQKVRGAR